jgi:hypothetical protein
VVVRLSAIAPAVMSREVVARRLWRTYTDGYDRIVKNRQP